MKVWIARDGKEGTGNLGDLTMFRKKPECSESGTFYLPNRKLEARIDVHAFPEIKNSEMKCFELVEVEG